MYKKLSRKRRKKPGLREEIEAFVRLNGKSTAAKVLKEVDSGYANSSIQLANYFAGNPNLIVVEKVRNIGVWDHVNNYSIEEKRRMARDMDLPGRTRVKLTTHLEELIL